SVVNRPAIWSLGGSVAFLPLRAVQIPDANVPEVHLVAVILEHGVPTPSFREPRDRAVLARGERGVHTRRAEVELHDLLAIQPVLAVRPDELDPRFVPLAPPYR